MRRRLDVEADEMSGFVKKKANQQWLGITMDAKGRRLVEQHGRSPPSATSSVMGDNIPQRCH
jgi:IS1 family transposase